MNVELRSRLAASDLHAAVADMRPRSLASPRRRFVRRSAFVGVAAALALIVTASILRTGDVRNEKIEDRIANRPKVAETKKVPNGDPGPSRRGPGTGRPSRGTAPVPALPDPRRDGAPDGARVQGLVEDRIAVVVESAGAPEIHVMRLDGTRRRFLAAGHEPDWSPDGRQIVYTRGRNQGTCLSVSSDANPEGCEIWIMEADGSDQRRIKPGWGADWSPDGRGIVYAAATGGDAELYVMNTDGSGTRQLTEYADDDLSGIASPDWSPDGRRVVFTRYESCGSNCRSNNGYVMNADGSELESLAIEASDPKWSPDGTRVAYRRGPFRGGHNNFEIYTIGTALSGETRVTNDAETASPMENFDWNPEWTPDGRILFGRDPDGPTGWSSCYLEGATPHCSNGGPAPSQLYLMNADGSGRIHIGEGRSAAFAPRQS